jgi:pimeloyl-ACP methyl ester carboxylesterase
MEEYFLLERLLLVSPKPTVASKRVAILVHGTWGAARGTWWKPRIGTLWQHVYSSWPHLYDGSSPFAWSGANRHMARVSAASQLIAWATTLGGGTLDVIAHSHGGNVCLLAARMGLSIDRLILLGTPIRTEYMLDLRRISSLANVFSLSDLVQTPLGTLPHRRGEGRTLADSPAVSNWVAGDDGTGAEPGHSDLHEPSTWIASGLDDLLR